jgi:hypothetical protein
MKVSFSLRSPGQSLVPLVLAVAYIGSCLAASSGEAAIKATVLQREKAALEVFRTHDKKAFVELCLPTFYEVTSSGSTNTLADELQELDDYTLGEYTMEDVVVTVVAPNAALIRYNIVAHYTFRGTALPVEPIVASAVWINKGGVWKAATYQEVVRKP